MHTYGTPDRKTPLAGYINKKQGYGTLQVFNFWISWSDLLTQTRIQINERGLEKPTRLMNYSGLEATETEVRF